MKAIESELDAFCDCLLLQDGLSANTLQSYRRDLRQFADWLQATQGIQSLLRVDRAQIAEYLAHRFRIQK